MTTGTNHSPTSTTVDPLKIELELLVAGEHGDPHHILGAHSDGDGTVVRGYRPDAESMTAVLHDGRRVGMTKEHPAGVFCGRVDEPVTDVLDDGGYQLEVRYPNGEPSRSTTPTASGRRWANSTFTSSARAATSRCGATSAPTSATTRM
jgi:hypothetical protein